MNGSTPTQQRDRLAKIPSLTIHKRLKRSRRLLQLSGYFDRLVSEIPLALTTGGVLYTVFALDQEGIAPKVLFFLIPLLVVPFIRLLRVSDEEKVNIIRKALRKDKRRALLHLLYHVMHKAKATIKFTNQATEIARRRRSGQPSSSAQLAKTQPDLQASIVDDYSEKLASILYDIFRFRSPENLLRFVLFQPEAIQPAADRYIEAINQWLVKPNEPTQTGKAKLELKRAENEMYGAYAELKEILSKYGTFQDPEIISEGLDVVTMPGTNRAIQALDEKLKKIQETKGFPAAKALLDLVDSQRVSSIKSIADLNGWYYRSAPFPDLLEKRINSTDVLSGNFLEYVKTTPGRDGQGLNLATSGFSTAVLRCLSAIRDDIGEVFVIDTGKSFLRYDHRQMARRLRDYGILVTLINISDASRRAFREMLDLAVFGIETVSFKGDILHPRGLTDALETLVFEPRPRLGIIGVGESWKVRIPSPDRLVDPSVVVVHEGRGFDYIITDHKVHTWKENARPRLNCCADYWRTIRRGTKILLDSYVEALEERGFTVITDAILDIGSADGTRLPEFVVVEGIDRRNFDRAGTTIDLKAKGGRLLFALEEDDGSDNAAKNVDGEGSIIIRAIEGEYFTICPLSDQKVESIKGSRIDSGALVGIDPNERGQVYSKELDLLFSIDVRTESLWVVDNKTRQSIVKKEATRRPDDLDEEKMGRKAKALVDQLYTFAKRA